jgi:decaprenyl-phosphate phosphoribosyltransferase
MLLGLLRSMRPHQWVKNAFVLAPLVFAQELGDVAMLGRALLATACFIAVSASVYLLNDCADIEKDRAHPVKRLRPIPSGRVTVTVALRVAAAQTVAALVAAALLTPWLALVLGGYAALNVAYSFRLKRFPVVDVLIIATGFLLRVLAGGLAIDRPLSHWLLLCTFAISLFLALGKRRHELAVARERAGVQRDALRGYSLGWLDAGLALTGLATVGAYTAYTLAPHTREVFGAWVPATIPFTALGLARFAALVRRTDASSPTDRMVRDPLFVATVLCWGALVIALIYG